ncbi:hypothetical protein C8Q70DRAFT_952172 [Cubamyces menziesii]|nr:hypothetical protein C8Q70DRAFT_952172 [Cubamyces menziesii]
MSVVRKFRAMSGTLWRCWWAAGEGSWPRTLLSISRVKAFSSSLEENIKSAAGTLNTLDPLASSPVPVPAPVSVPVPFSFSPSDLFLLRTCFFVSSSQIIPKPKNKEKNSKRQKQVKIPEPKRRPPQGAARAPTPSSPRVEERVVQVYPCVRCGRRARGHGQGPRLSVLCAGDVSSSSSSSSRPSPRAVLCSLNTPSPQPSLFFSSLL